RTTRRLSDDGVEKPPDASSGDAVAVPMVKVTTSKLNARLMLKTEDIDLLWLRCSANLSP
ncbi:MAG: hypothetical protein ACREX9_07465, partial [Gammaproteobacteria bacterium]